MKLVIEILGIVVVLGAAFLVVNFVHFQFFTVSVILYSCLLDALLASLIVLPAYWYLRGKAQRITVSEFSMAAIIGNLLIVIYAIMGPTVIDRSLSIYIVEKLQSRGGQIAEAAFSDVLDQEFMSEYRVAEVRLTEQVASGTAVIENGCIKLTARGEVVASLAHWYRKTFLPKKRVLLDQVTDALTDPLRNSVPLVDVTCPTPTSSE
ncbi:MAG: hypothetical protein EOP84_02645 [Verrucomicrobiaceae bacterium]|nr:MAG: hypothetical protein EOP84_02645 [Verrucomicrobiaceae bacterium]